MQNPACFLAKRQADFRSVQEVSSLTGLALHRTIRKIPNGAGEPQSLGSPPSLRSRIIKIALSLDNYAMAWTIPHFEEIQLNCEINSYASARL